MLWGRYNYLFRTGRAALKTWRSKVPKKRDSAYYRKRLSRDFPAIFAELRAGTIKSVRKAAIKARLIKMPSRLDALKREWKRATTSQRVAFLTWIKTSRTGPKAKTKIKPAIVDAEGRLRPHVKLGLQNWCKINHSKISQITSEMGLPPLDTSLSSAIERSYKLRPDMIARLERWLELKGL
jgi:hypothetical protein